MAYRTQAEMIESLEHHLGCRLRAREQIDILDLSDILAYIEDQHGTIADLKCQVAELADALLTFEGDDDAC